MAGRGRGKEDPVPVAAQEEEEEDEEEDGDEEEDEYVCTLADPPNEKEKRLLTRRMFPSKVGGKPAWLVPSDLPSVSSGELACKECSRPLRFLLQIYCSRDETPAAFHRVLHLFVCTSCQPNQVRLFRAQLPRENDFYSYDPPNADKIEKAVRTKGDPQLSALCCAECGLPRAPEEKANCAECDRLLRNKEEPAMFQERELNTEEADLPDEEDQPEEVPAAAAAGKKKLGAIAEGEAAEEPVEEVFTEGALKAAGKDKDLVAEADGVIEAAKARGASAAVLEKLDAYRDKVAECSENAMDASEQAAFDSLAKEQGEYDPLFSRFNAYGKENPAHVIRYIYGGSPLWFCTPNRMQDPPPPCEHCGAERIFEFQVQPQLIALLLGTRLADRLDFGTICCYVCSKNCGESAPRRYLEEFAYVQPEPHDAFLPKG